jgi:hypothetical protein
MGTLSLSIGDPILRPQGRRCTILRTIYGLFMGLRALLLWFVAFAKL